MSLEKSRGFPRMIILNKKIIKIRECRVIAEFDEINNCTQFV